MLGKDGICFQIFGRRHSYLLPSVTSFTNGCFETNISFFHLLHQQDIGEYGDGNVFSAILRTAVLVISRIRWLSNFFFFQANLPSVQENTKKTIIESHIQILVKLLKGTDGSDSDESMPTFRLFNKLLLYSLCTAENESEILKMIMSADILHQNINEEENLKHVKDFQKTFVESFAIQIA